MTPGYAVLGRLIIDDLVFADGGEAPGMLGGAGLYAALGAAMAGERTAGLVSGVGRDLGRAELGRLSSWGIVTTGLTVAGEHTSRSRVVYHADGERSETPLLGLEHFATMAPRITGVPRTWTALRGLYLFAGVESRDWDGVIGYARATGCALLWEISADAATPDHFDEVSALLGQVDVFSVNLAEARALCGSTEPADCVAVLAAAGAKRISLRMERTARSCATVRDSSMWAPPPAGRWPIRPGPATATAALCWPPTAIPVTSNSQAGGRPRPRRWSSSSTGRPRRAVRSNGAPTSRPYAASERLLDPPAITTIGARMTDSALRDQVESLGQLIRDTTWQVEDHARGTLSTPDHHALQLVLLTGCGDSYFAARAAQFAWQELAGVPCFADDALTAARYRMRDPGGRRFRPLVIAVSHSGRGRSRRRGRPDRPGAGPVRGRGHRHRRQQARLGRRPGPAGRRATLRGGAGRPVVRHEPARPLPPRHPQR